MKAIHSLNQAAEADMQVIDAYVAQNITYSQLRLGFQFINGELVYVRVVR